MFGLKKATIKTVVITGLGIAVGSVLFIPALTWAKARIPGLSSIG